MNAPSLNVLSLPQDQPCPRWRFPSAFPMTVRYAEVTQELVAQAFGLTVNEMLANNRRARVVWPRQVAMFLTLELTAETTQHVASLFNRKDHTTVMYAQRAVLDLMSVYPDLAAEVENLKQKIVREVKKSV